ncbi:MAG TPA: NAD(P)/FAD-dependent oxidoreductase [Thermoflexia bacterium]|jgi:geranylgeranyl reductase family protein|nr:NAD(P)/FAD-dependent oxidoreductase [Thermoflexia bacterium]
MFDVIVVGAGPAGSSAAYRLANNGWRVALLERSNEPGEDNVCGGMVSLPMVKRFGVFPDAVEKEMRSELHVFPWGVIENTTEQCTVRRSVFDRLLAQRAVAAGAELMTRTLARAVRVVAPGRVEVEVQRRSTRRLTRLRGRGLILADGPRTLARSLGLGCRLEDGGAAFALTYELAWPGNEMNHYELYYGGDIALWGYAWIFPYRDVLNVGLGCVRSELKRRGSLQRDLVGFIRSHPRASRLLDDKPIVRRRGGWIPLRPSRRMVGPSTLVVGDAAGLVHPLIAAGVDNALASGDLAGQVMSEALAADDLSASFLARFQRRWQRTTTARFMEIEDWIARIGRPLSRVDRDMLAKVIQLCLLGGTMSWLGKVQVLGYPLLGTPQRARRR